MAKADRHYVEKRRVRGEPVCGPGECGLGEIVADVKRQLIGADAKRLAADQRRIGAAVGVGDRFLEEPAGAGADLVQHDLHAGGGAAAHGVEHVGRQPSDRVRLARPLDRGDHAQPGDQADLGERRGLFGCGIVLQPPLELPQDRIPGVAADANDEGKAELLPVGGIEGAEAVELLRAQPVEAEPALFGLGVAGPVRPLDPAAQFRVAADEGLEPFRRGGPDRLHHGPVQRLDGGIGPAFRHRLRHPGGMFERFADCCDKGGGGHDVQGLEALRRACHGLS